MDAIWLVFSFILGMEAYAAIEVYREWQRWKKKLKKWEEKYGEVS